MSSSSSSFSYSTLSSSSLTSDAVSSVSPSSSSPSSSLYDVRIHNYHIIPEPFDYEKWSTDFSKFPGLPFAFNWELYLRTKGDIMHKWMQDNWAVSIWISCAYVLVIFGLKHMMSSRKPMNLRLPLFVWNCLLAVFSIFGTIRCLPEFIDVFVNKGFVLSYCDSSYYHDFRVTWWFLFFVWSKSFELGDTIFIVLRKQKLYKLHWIHHVLTLCYSWYVFGNVPATARWMVNMNFLIHSAMYSYYALKALRFRIPKPISVSITTSQIIQMLMGFYINLKTYQFKLNGTPCDSSRSVAAAGLLLYSLFFILFINYFFRAYILPCLRTQTKSITFDNNNNQLKIQQHSKKLI